MKRRDLGHLSFEFFPPKTDRERRNLLRTVRRLDKYSPDFYSVTHGAGGSTRDGTFQTVQMLREQGFNAIPHLSWGPDSESEMFKLLSNYDEMGVSQLVVLRGDRSSDSQTTAPQIRYAQELVELIRREKGNRFHLNVACYPEVHPEANTLSEDIGYLREKVAAGADTCITQYFFASEAFRVFVDSCRLNNIHVPIVAGIMPISNFEKLVRFSAKCGAELPRWLNAQLSEMTDDKKQLREFGSTVVANLCRQLWESNRCGMHFYTLNRARPTQAIFEKLFDS